jgi:hypothetical protein
MAPRGASPNPRKPVGRLFPDTEPAEDRAKKVVGGEFAGDFAERVLGEAQFLGEEFERGLGAFDHAACCGDALLRGG